MNQIKNILIIVISFLFFGLSACKNKTAKPSPELNSIDLLRGDILLCGDGDFGELKFSLSCSYDTRETFDLGVALLHSFQYTEAEKVFVKVIDTDPNCAMGYWGVAMSIYHAAWFPPNPENLKKGTAVLSIAKKLSMDEKQRDYINAIDAFYSDWENTDHATRAKRFEDKMEQMYLKYTDDIEAAIFYSLALFSTRDRVGKDYANERKAGKILEGLFAANPKHPGIAHYIIHNYDNPVLAPQGLETARRYAKIAPSSSHAQHMPSHIFTQLGLWDESIQSNLLSAESSRCYTQAAALKGTYFEELHAIDYLVYAYLQKGDNANAEKQYNLIKSKKSFYPGNITAAIYPVAAIPVRLALENRNWEQAANLQLQEIDLKWDEFPWQKAIHHFAKALGAAHTKQFVLAESEIDILKKLHKNLIAQNDSTKYIQIKQVEIQIKASMAWLDFKKNNHNAGLALLQEAVEIERKTSNHPVSPGDVLPAIEMLGDMLLEMAKNDLALAAYEENLINHPNRFNGIYGAAVASKRSGNNQKAIRYYSALLELANNVKMKRAELKEAKEFIEKKQI